MKQPLAPFAAKRADCRGALSAGDRFNRLLLDVAVWRGVLALAVPVRRLFALLLLCTKSCWTLAGDAKRVLWQALGWLSAPPKYPFLKQLGLGVVGSRRWHYAVGEATNSAPAVLSHSFVCAGLSELQACCIYSSTMVLLLWRGFRI